MKRSSTDELISALARGIRPVRRVAPLGWQATGVCAVAAALLLALVMLSGLRRDELGAGSGSAPFLLTSLGLALVSLGGVTAALASSRPGRERLEWRSITISIAALAICGSAAALVLLGTPLAGDPGWGGVGEIPCVLSSLTSAIIPALILIRLAASGAPLRPERTALWAGWGATGLAAFAANLTCRTPGAWHEVLTHALIPVLGSLLLMTALGALLRRWTRAT